MTLTRSDIDEESLRIAQRILDDDPDCVVRYRLLRDVLRRPNSDAEVHAARRQVLSSPQVKVLAEEQLPDGSWGRLHTADSKAERRIGSTEGGVSCAISLGMTAEDGVLARASSYLASVLRGERRSPDHERNERWLAGEQLFAGSHLALIQPYSPALDALWERWAEILRRTFATGSFDPEAEVAAHRDLHGIRDEIGYLHLRNRYSVMLLGARARELPARIRKGYVRWLWNQPRGLGYVDVVFWPPPNSPRGHQIGGWLHALDLLLAFDPPKNDVERCVDWLWSLRGENGLWDFGPSTRQIRFSENWRRKGRRAQDHSLVPLVLIRRVLEKGRRNPFRPRL